MKNSTAAKLARDIADGIVTEPQGVVDFNARILGWFLPRGWEPDEDYTAPTATMATSEAIERARTSMEAADAHVAIERILARLEGRAPKLRSRWSIEAIARRHAWSELVNAPETIGNHSVTTEVNEP